MGRCRSKQGAPGLAFRSCTVAQVLHYAHEPRPRSDCPFCQGPGVLDSGRAKRPSRGTRAQTHLHPSHIALQPLHTGPSVSSSNRSGQGTRPDCLSHPGCPAETALAALTCKRPLAAAQEATRTSAITHHVSEAHAGRPPSGFRHGISRTLPLLPHPPLALSYFRPLIFFMRAFPAASYSKKKSCFLFYSFNCNQFVAFL